MRDARLLGPTRIKGKPVIVRRLHRLRLALARYQRHRATTDDEHRWAARLADALDLAARAADPTTRNEVTMTVPDLCLKPNNCASNDPCAICGQRCDPDVGLEPFIAGTWNLVCHDCLTTRRPDLAAELTRVETR